MKKFLLALAIIAAVFVVVVSSRENAQARSQYHKAFVAMYGGDGAKTEFVETITGKDTKCNTCHNPNKLNDEGKKSKEFRNAYGAALDKLLDKEDKKNLPKINSALKEVGKQKDASGVTFDELFKSGKLPANPADKPK